MPNTPVIDEVPIATVSTTRQESQQPSLLPPYAVIVHNDDKHTFEYVIETFQKVFGWSSEKAFHHAEAIHRDGMGIVWSGSKEVAELKRDQLLGAGPDLHANPAVKFPLGVEIEPLPG